MKLENAKRLQKDLEYHLKLLNQFIESAAENNQNKLDWEAVYDYSKGSEDKFLYIVGFLSSLQETIDIDKIEKFMYNYYGEYKFDPKDDIKFIRIVDEKFKTNFKDMDNGFNFVAKRALDMDDCCGDDWIIKLSNGPITVTTNIATMLELIERYNKLINIT